MDPSIIISLFAALFSLLAIFVTVIYRKKDARPWLVIEQFRMDRKDDDSIEIVATAKHVAGGPALNVNYQFSIEGHESGYNKDCSAIFPGVIAYLHMPALSGWDPGPDDEIAFFINYKDIYDNSYSLKQIKKAPSYNLKYESSPKREFRNLWLKI
jgi:hypothetical protein